MKILIAGDYCPIGRVEKCIEHNKYDAVFSEILPFTEQADYSIVNLECPVCLEDYRPIYKQGPNLQSKTKNAVEALKYAGFDMVTLANNHVMDYGEEGVRDTMQVCKEYGIDMVGIGENLVDANKVVYKQIEGKILAVINCCEHEFSIATDASAGACPLNPIQQFHQIQKARKNADYVLVIVHGGHEHFQLPSIRMQVTYRFYIDAGADAVVNHHQHCFTGMETYNTKPIYYGIGNFCFDRGKHTDIWHEGFMLELDFQCDGIKTNEIPYIQCYGEPKVEIQSDSEQFFSRFNELSGIITNEEKLKEQVGRYYESQFKLIDIIWEPYMNRYMRKLRMMKLVPSVISKRKLTGFLNYIDCEAHRDKLLYYLHKKNKA